MSEKVIVRGDARGMVSFMVTLIMMIVITLIVVGFSQVTRRNQRESLDRQLSAQAFYAAESGINVTKTTLINYVSANGYSGLVTKTSCPNDYSPTNASGTTPIAPLSAGVRYTCVLVNPAPNSLEFSATQRDSIVMPISANANLKTLTIAWSEQDGGTNSTCAGGSDDAFVPSDTWGADCDLGLLRLDLIANPGSNATNANSLASNTVSLFLTPRGTHSGATTVSFGGATTAYVASGVDYTAGSGACSSGTCKATVTLPDNTPNYMIRATMLYKDSKTVTVTGTTDSGTANFYGAQAIVDVTGQDQDELRRVQARVSLSSSGDNIPANAVASNKGICKQFAILPTGSVNFGTAANCN